jgi:hypothetical protein
MANEPVDLAERVARKRVSSKRWIDPNADLNRLRRAQAGLAGTKPISDETLKGLRTDTDKVNYILAALGEMG